MRQHLLCLLVLVAGAAPLAADDGTALATTLRIVEPTFTSARVEPTGVTPPGFEILLQKEMPSPGWRFGVGRVDTDEGARRVRVEVVEVAPRGMTAQVLTPTALNIPVGSLTPGRWLLELWVRRESEPRFRLTQALVVDARP